MTHTVFVYGTLKRGFPNHALMEGASFLGVGRTMTAYPMVLHGAGFSVVMLPEPGAGHRILGELWRMDDARLVALDQLEATHLPTGYVRDTIDVETDGGTTTTAWVYFKARDRIDAIHNAPHADYQDRRYVPLHLRKS